MIQKFVGEEGGLRIAGLTVPTAFIVFGILTLFSEASTRSRKWIS